MGEKGWSSHAPQVATVNGVYLSHGKKEEWALHKLPLVVDPLEKTQLMI